MLVSTGTHCYSKFQTIYVETRNKALLNSLRNSECLIYRKIKPTQKKSQSLNQ